MKSGVIRESYRSVIWVYCLILLLAAFAVLALLFPKSAPSGAIEWSVAMGTTLLALFTFIATRENRRQTGIDRRMRFIESQLEGLHSQVIGEESNFMIGKVPEPEAFELIKKKRYLADVELRLKIYEILTDFDLYNDAKAKYEAVKDFLGSAPEDAKEKRDLELRYDESHGKLTSCGRELVRLAKRDYDTLDDELQKLSGKDSLTELEQRKEHVEKRGAQSVEISTDAMRTSIWQILVGTFVASYVTLYVAMVLSVSHPISGWIASPIAAGVGALLALGFLMVFLSIMRMSPRLVLAWTDRLANWALRKNRSN